MQYQLSQVFIGKLCSELELYLKSIYNSLHCGRSFLFPDSGLTMINRETVS